METYISVFKLVFSKDHSSSSVEYKYNLGPILNSINKWKSLLRWKGSESENHDMKLCFIFLFSPQNEHSFHFKRMKIFSSSKYKNNISKIQKKLSSWIFFLVTSLGAKFYYVLVFLINSKYTETCNLRWDKFK